MPKGFFVTGTDTNVGKTVLSAVLCSGLPGIYWKPIQTGASEGTDRNTVSSWMGMKPENLPPEVYLFDDPVSPHLAAQWAAVEIDLNKITLPNVRAGAPLIVEGAGGVMVPVNQHQFMTDLICHLGLPVIIAARSTLGTINHTLLSVYRLRDLGASVRGVVLIGPPNAENKKAIEHYGSVQVVGEIPPLESIKKETLQGVFTNHFAREAFA